MLYAFNMDQAGEALIRPDYIYYNPDAEFNNPHAFDVSWVGNVDRNKRNYIITMSKEELIILNSTTTQSLFYQIQ